MKNDDTNEHLNRLLKTQDIEYVIAPHRIEEFFTTYDILGNK